MTTPDFDRAATKALETLIKYEVKKVPVFPRKIFEKAEGWNLVTFTEMSNTLGIDRTDIINLFSTENHDAITSAFVKDGKTMHIVAYNMRLPDYLIQRAVAREMGHIVLCHDGSLPEDVRLAEAQCFAYHLLCPRPLINAIQQSSTKLTVEVLGNITGCYERCLIGMSQTPATHVPAELNRKAKEMFSDYLDEFLDFQTFLEKNDRSMIANFGSYMEGYEE